MLELFSGTGSFGDVIREKGWEVVSVDCVAACNPTIVADVLTLDFRALGEFDFVWASPPCTQYSIARSKAKTPRHLGGVDALVRRALEIIETLRPRAWCLENPQSGLLKSRSVVAGLPYFDVDYCAYGAPFRKRTRIWSNLAFTPPPPCKQDCAACDGGRHREWAQKAARRRGEAGFATSELGRLPRQLVE